MTLHLSQHLTINGKYTISVPGETEEYFGSCDEFGYTEDTYVLKDNVAWYALTKEASKVWKGELKTDGEFVLGLLKASTGV